MPFIELNPWRPYQIHVPIDHFSGLRKSIDMGVCVCVMTIIEQSDL